MKVIGNKIILDNGTELTIDPEPPKNKTITMLQCSKHKLYYPSNKANCYLCNREIRK